VTLRRARCHIVASAATGLIHVCLPFLLEAGYSVRNARDHDALID
jgi:hypothetical protein